MAEGEPVKIQPKRPPKRKRVEPCPVTFSAEEKMEKINGFRNEIDSLVRLCKQFVLENRGALVEYVEKERNVHLNSEDRVVACLMEESHLPLSKLVDDIFEKFELGNWGGSVTKASVKRIVITVGQRLPYGVVDADTDVLEDETESALWCWETRDLKLIPKSARNPVRVRRTCRKKIHERISAVFATVTALEKLEDHQKWQHELMKSSEKLAKVLDEADIQLLIQNILQKDGAEMAEDTMKEEKQLIKQMEKSKRETEKERKKMSRELQIEKLQREKELKRQQEESEKEQRRKEKEEAELKKQLALQKQASIMERFVIHKTDSSSKISSSANKTAKSESSSTMAGTGNFSESASLTMDNVLAQNVQADTETIWRLHLKAWRCARSSMHSIRKNHWGVRQKPKTELVKELKLIKNKELNNNEDLNIQQLVDGWADSDVDRNLFQTNMDGLACVQKKPRSRKLLQFDNCHRPAFYGVWPRKSQVVGARRPFAKDPDINYEIDSDEEWEEDEPGENLSDCVMEDEDESMEAQLDSDDEIKDGFFVPDGYLSENEGVPGDDDDEMESDELMDEVGSMLDSQKQAHHEAFSSLLQQQKYLNNLTEHALKKNQPLIISNLMHEKSTPVPVEELVIGKEKPEQIFLQTLSVRPLPGFCEIEMSTPNNSGDEDLESSSNKPNTVKLTPAASVLDSALPHMVSIIQSCNHGIVKIVESMHEKFPSISKAQLRNKVQEISEFSDNRWQVKKEILSLLGLSTSPAKGKSVAALLKNYLPPPGNP